MTLHKSFFAPKEVLAFIFLLFAFQAYSQGAERLPTHPGLQLSGIIVDQQDTSVISYVNIVNKNTHEGTSSDLNGNFLIAINVQDTIIFSSVGFESYILTFAKNDLKSDHYFIKIALNRSTLQLEPVTIYAFKDEADFKNDILNLEVSDSTPKIIIPGAFQGTPQAVKTHVYFESGIGCEGCITSFLNLFNKESKEKKLYGKAVQKWFARQQIHEKYNPEVVQKITGLEDRALVDFMSFCKMSDEFILRVQ